MTRHAYFFALESGSATQRLGRKKMPDVWGKGGVLAFLPLSLKD